MYITVDDIEKETSFHYPIDNRNGNKKVGLIRAHFVYNEKIHLKNGETLKVKRGCYTMKDIERVSSGKVKYDSLTGKSVIDSSIRRSRPYMNKTMKIISIVNEVIDRLKISLNDGDGNEISSNFKVSIVLHVV